MLKIRWADKITKDEVFHRAKEEWLLLKTLKNRHHSWMWHINSYNEIVVNILERAISGEKAVRRKTSTTILNPLNTKGRPLYLETQFVPPRLLYLKTQFIPRSLLYLKTQFVPRSKHFLLHYKNQSVYAVSGTSRCLFSDKYKTHKYSVGRTYSCWMFNVILSV